MLLFALSAFVLGVYTVTPLAAALLTARASHPDTTPRMPSPTREAVVRVTCASALAVAACWSWRQCADACAMVTFVLAAAAMLTALICDCRARIIPWETCLVLLACGCVYGWRMHGISELVFALGLAAAVIGMLELCRLAARQLGRPEPVGAGDLRILPGLCALGGIGGSIYGACACAAGMGLVALCVIVRARGHPHGGAPMAPGFALWLCVAAGCG